jgi:hypothetical protein
LLFSLHFAYTDLCLSHRLAEYLQSEPDRKRAAAEAQRSKLEALERKLGITPDSNGEVDVLAGKKHRLDDTEYLEQSREIVDNVKSAVVAGAFFCCFENMAASMCTGLLKKKKKAKTSQPTSELPDKTSPCLESEKANQSQELGRAEEAGKTGSTENMENSLDTEKAESAVPT